MNASHTATRQERLLAKAKEKILQENSNELEKLRVREDRLPAYDYFLQLIENVGRPLAVTERTGRPLLNVMCLQAPLEMIHAAGFSPFKVFSGSHAASSLAFKNLPSLMCPMMKSVLGSIQTFYSAASSVIKGWILPTTCDWMVNYPKMLAALDINIAAPLHYMELPHLKESSSSQKHWLDEVFHLRNFLESLCGRKIKRKQLLKSISVYQRAWQAMNCLASLRKDGAIDNCWFMLIQNTFFLDDPAVWADAVEKLLPDLRPSEINGGRIFLAGSPIFFPNFKILHLLQEAGLQVVADDLCSSERLLPGAVVTGDSSEFGLLEALAQRYHQACLCPTFADNDRRINNILGRLESHGIEGVVFHVLKACHPFDLESFTLESSLKKQGLKFLRLETDYAAEDSQNLLTRLEAFRQTLGSA